MLITGDKLNPRQRALVLNAFGYRWTVENHERARYWHGANAPTMQPQTDEIWLREHAFHFIVDGSRLMFNRRHAEPAFMANA